MLENDRLAEPPGVSAEKPFQLNFKIIPINMESEPLLTHATRFGLQTARALASQHHLSGFRPQLPAAPAPIGFSARRHSPVSVLDRVPSQQSFRDSQNSSSSLMERLSHCFSSAKGSGPPSTFSRSTSSNPSTVSQGPPRLKRGQHRVLLPDDESPFVVNSAAAKTIRRQERNLLEDMSVLSSVRLSLRVGTPEDPGSRDLTWNLFRHLKNYFAQDRRIRLIKSVMKEPREPQQPLAQAAVDLADSIRQASARFMSRSIGVEPPQNRPPFRTLNIVKSAIEGTRQNLQTASRLIPGIEQDLSKSQKELKSKNYRSDLDKENLDNLLTASKQLQQAQKHIETYTGALGHLIENTPV